MHKSKLRVIIALCCRGRERQLLVHDFPVGRPGQEKADAAKSGFQAFRACGEEKPVCSPRGIAFSAGPGSTRKGTFVTVAERLQNRVTIKGKDSGLTSYLLGAIVARHVEDSFIRFDHASNRFVALIGFGDSVQTRLSLHQDFPGTPCSRVYSPELKKEPSHDRMS